MLANETLPLVKQYTNSLHRHFVISFYIASNIYLWYAMKLNRYNRKNIKYIKSTWVNMNIILMG